MIRSKSDSARSEVKPRLRPYVSRRAESASDIDKVLRECFIRIHGGIVRDRDGERLLRWIYRTVDDAIVDCVRVRVAKGPRSAEFHDGSRGRDEEILRAALSEVVERLIRGLPEPYREAITLTELDGRTHQEAASALGLSFAATRERVRRGRQKIRDTFDECCRVSVGPDRPIVEPTLLAIEKIRDGINLPRPGRFRRNNEYL